MKYLKKGELPVLTIISDAKSWLNDQIPLLIKHWTNSGYRCTWVHQPKDIPKGDICFILSYSKILGSEVLRKNNHNLVVHESALPEGKGWSPLTWQILEGKSEITVTLFEASEAVDSGPIYLQNIIKFEGYELVEDLRKSQGDSTLDLCKIFVAEFPMILKRARPQVGSESFYPKRSAENSRLNPYKTIAEQFNLLRVVDNERYPAFSEWQGQRYALKIEKVGNLLKVQQSGSCNSD